MCKCLAYSKATFTCCSPTHCRDLAPAKSALDGRMSKSRVCWRGGTSCVSGFFIFFFPFFFSIKARGHLVMFHLKSRRNTNVYRNESRICPVICHMLMSGFKKSFDFFKFLLSIFKIFIYKNISFYRYIHNIYICISCKHRQSVQNELSFCIDIYGQGWGFSKPNY